MKEISLNILVLVLLTYVAYSQADPHLQDNFVDPVVVNPDSHIPAEPVESTNAYNNPGGQQNDLPGKQPNTQEIPQNSNLNQQIPILQPVPTANPEEIRLQQQRARLAKEQADKARKMAEQARIQAQKERAARESRQEDQLRKIKVDGSISLTQRKKQEQRLNFRREARKVEAGTKFTEYLFEQPSGLSEFFIKLPVSQQVALNFYTYVAEDNTYVRTKNIEEQQPVQVYVYENNQRILYQGEFYFQLYLTFQGQAGAMYLIRVINPGLTKLISMNTKKLIENAHLDETLVKQQAGAHVERTQNLAIQVNKWFQTFRKNSMLDFQDIKRVSQTIRKYYAYELLESLLCIVFCVIQIKMIGKLLKGNSIV